LLREQEVGSSNLLSPTIFVPSAQTSRLRATTICAQEEEMKIIKINEVSKVPAASPLFTGPDVTRQVLVPDSKEFNVNIVTFGKGVRNKFHAHDGEQILIVTAGKGIVATEEEETVVTIGDVILFSAGEKHWHGATEDSEFSHLYVMREGIGPTTQLED
jgi:quercetin dioxygenase-like cupin family protein